MRTMLTIATVRTERHRSSRPFRRSFGTSFGEARGVENGNVIKLHQSHQRCYSSRRMLVREIAFEHSLIAIRAAPSIIMSNRPPLSQAGNNGTPSESTIIPPSPPKRHLPPLKTFGPSTNESAAATIHHLPHPPTL